MADLTKCYLNLVYILFYGLSGLQYQVTLFIAPVMPLCEHPRTGCSLASVPPSGALRKCNQSDTQNPRA
jgi:hypothetical protein